MAAQSKKPGGMPGIEDALSDEKLGMEKTGAQLGKLNPLTDVVNATGLGGVLEQAGVPAFNSKVDKASAGEAIMNAGKTAGADDAAKSFIPGSGGGMPGMGGGKGGGMPGMDALPGGKGGSMPGMDMMSGSGGGKPSIPGLDALSGSGGGKPSIPGMDMMSGSGGGKPSIPGMDALSGSGGGKPSIPGMDAIPKPGGKEGGPPSLDKLTTLLSQKPDAGGGIGAAPDPAKLLEKGPQAITPMANDKMGGLPSPGGKADFGIKPSGPKPTGGEKEPDAEDKKSPKMGM